MTKMAGLPKDVPEASRSFFIPCTGAQHDRSGIAHVASCGEHRTTRGTRSEDAAGPEGE